MVSFINFDSDFEMERKRKALFWPFFSKSLCEGVRNLPPLAFFKGITIPALFGTTISDKIFALVGHFYNAQLLVSF